MPDEEGHSAFGLFSDALARAGGPNLPTLDHDPMAVHRRLAAIAKRGARDPTSLSTEDIQQVCYALEVRYSLFLR